MNNLCRVIVLIGGNGSNLQALIDNAHEDSSYKIVGVISHRPEVYGLNRAHNAGIPTKIIDHTLYSNRKTFEEALIHAAQAFEPDLIVLAGFMRLLSPLFIQHYQHQIMNIHPSLLPKFKGLDTHQRVLSAKEKEHGASVHFVTEELDGGPIIAQIKVPVMKEDTVETLSKRVLAAEHTLYPQVVIWFAQKRLKYDQNIVTLDSRRLGSQGVDFTTKEIVS